MNGPNGISEKAARALLVGLAAHQLELEHEQDGELTLQQRGAIRTELYWLVPTQEPGALAMWWDTVVSQQRIRQDIIADFRDALWTYQGIEFPTDQDVTYLDNEAITDQRLALDALMHPAPMARVTRVVA